jgi:Ser/Thr protein kinase RdoA (MazF antagonist)
MLIAQSTPHGEAIAQVVKSAYALGDVTRCVLFRRGFNHVYGLTFAGGRRAVARLHAERPRGAPNTEYEAALLAHVQLAGVSVAACLPAADGAVAVPMQLPEGSRLLMLFEHLDGEPPGDNLADVEATGHDLALLHTAAEDYHGPASRYVLQLPHLLERPLRTLWGAPTMTDVLRVEFDAIAQRLAERIESLSGLARVACHGDCHGSNNFMVDGSEGRRVSSFFDFEETGPGWLAYELCVYLWAMLPRKPGGKLDEEALERWRRYLAGYRAVRPLAAADFDAIAAFVSVRQFWLMGEYAGRADVWGTESIPTSWLRKQVELLHAWDAMATPA